MCSRADPQVPSSLRAPGEGGSEARARHDSRHFGYGPHRIEAPMHGLGLGVPGAGGGAKITVGTVILLYHTHLLGSSHVQPLEFSVTFEDTTINSPQHPTLFDH